jgi:hypothetical protein
MWLRNPQSLGGQSEMERAGQSDEGSQLLEVHETTLPPLSQR